EWPRIRDIGTPQQPDYLMTMHGMFWRFPATFSTTNTSGIRPRSAYLKVVGDFTRWNDRLVFGTDDSAQKNSSTRERQKAISPDPDNRTPTCGSPAWKNRMNWERPHQEGLFG